MKTHILLIDDDPAAHEAVTTSLMTACYEVDIATTARDGLSHFHTDRHAAVLLDLLMTDQDGMALLCTMRRVNPRIPVIMLTGLTTVKPAVMALKLGAEDYLTKPVDPEELRSALERAIAAHALDREVCALRAQVRARYAFHNLIGKSPSMQDIYSKIEQVADTRTTVLITGESGTGKELVARALHHNSSRRAGPFIGLNCAAIPENLLENELFGHEKGSFTDARTRQIGQFELANGGTLFLDEISELSLTMQAKLLRVIQEREFRRIGGVQPIKLDVRFIAATNRDLTDLVASGRFREDMYYRINVVSLFLHPLRDRRPDISLLAQHFLTKSGVGLKQKPERFSEEALDLLVKYDWPGNVRELENAVEQASVWCTQSEILPEHLPPLIRKTVRTATLRSASLAGDMSLPQAVVILERETIMDALRRTAFVQTRAAGLLGITRRQLKYKMDQYGLQRPERPWMMDGADCPSP